MRQILITLLLLVEATAIQYNNTRSLRRYEMTISAYSCNLNIQDFESTLSNFLNATSENIHIETTCKMESTINMDTYMPDYYFSWLIEYRNNFDQNESETKLTNSSLLDQFSNEAAYLQVVAHASFLKPYRHDLHVHVRECVPYFSVSVVVGDVLVFSPSY